MGRSRMFLRWLVAAFVALVVVGQWGAGWGSAACDNECRQSCAGACCAREGGPASDELLDGAVDEDEGCCSKKLAHARGAEHGPVAKGACNCGHRRIELAALLERWIEPVSVEVSERDAARDAAGPPWRERSRSSSRPEPTAPPPKG